MVSDRASASLELAFCLFADDTGIFNQQDFKLFLENRSAGGM
jgi:hypothetical protein